MMQLRIAGDHPQVVWLRKPTYLIGRSAACNIRIADGDVRPIHACLKVAGNKVRLLRHQDALVEINGEAARAEHTLTDGDEIVLGDQLLQFVEHSGKSDVIDSQTVSRPATDPQPSAPSWKLCSLTPALAERCFEIRASAVIGRGKDCDIRLGEAHLSRHHARLTPLDQGLKLEDLESANGTFVNGRRVHQAILKHGDEVSLDKLKFRVEHEISRGGEAEPWMPLAESEQEPVLQHELADPQSAPVARPTAIEVQQAKVRRLCDERVQRSSRQSGPHKMGSPASWLTVTVAVIAVVGMIWGARSFFQVPFPG